MDLDNPFDLSDENLSRDLSGTPAAFLEAVRRSGDLVVLDEIDPSNIAIAFVFGPLWREQTGCDRFVRLRQPVEGKRHALIRHQEPQSQGPARNGRSDPFPVSDAQLLPYAEDDPVGRMRGFEGAGIMAYQTGDQMHPPMVDRADLWSDVKCWPEAAQLHTREAAEGLDLQPGERVLDIGCGICGPARQLVDEFGVTIYAIANSDRMLLTAQEINARQSAWRESIAAEFHDCQDPLARRGFDAAWSMNMIYRVADKPAMLANAFEALREGGRLMIEDWLFTDLAESEHRLQMADHHQADLMTTGNELARMIEDAGFRLTARHDLGGVGRTHLANYFVPLFNGEIRPQLERDFPSKPMSGKQMADEWVDGIQATIDLYRGGQMTYERFYAVRDAAGQDSGGVRS